MKDELFIRGDVPMTKEEIRAIALSKLDLDKNSVLWDIGAGTGSISVEASVKTPGLKVLAFENNPEAVKLIHANSEKFGCENIEVFEGTFPDSFKELLSDNGELLSKDRVPTHAFLGGTKGRLSETVDLLRGLNPNIKIVMTAVTLETIGAVEELMKSFKVEAEITFASITKTRKLGDYHLFNGLNMVAIITFGGTV